MMKETKPATFPQTDLQSENTSLYRTTSPLAEGPFPCNAKEVHNNFFYSANCTQVSGVDVVAENDVNSSYVTQIEEQFYQTSDSSFHDNNVTESLYKIKIFVSKDDSYLQKAFEKTEPLHNEVCLFLEDNSSDFFSGSSAYIKVGEGFRADLATRQDIANSESTKIHTYDFINEQGENNLQLDFSDSQLNELISTGKITNISRTLLVGVMQALNFGTIFLAPLYQFLGDGVLGITSTLRKSGWIKFQDHHWNPEAKKNKEGNNSFKPVLLLPLSLTDLGDLESLGETGINKVTNTIESELKNRLNSFKSNWQTLANFPASSYVIPSGVTTFINQAQTKTEELIEWLISGVKQIATVFLNIGSQWIYALNAFYCGLWNSIVEAILGMVDLIGYILKGLGIVGNGINNAQTLIPQAQELLDEMIQTLYKTDFTSLIKKTFNFIQKQVAKLSIQSLAGSISIEKVCYFLGAFVGFVTEIVVGLLYSGGVNSVVKALDYFGDIGKSVVNLLKSSITKVTGTISEFSLLTIINFVKKIIALSKKGEEAVIRFINDIFDAIKSGAKLADDVLQQIKSVFKLTDDELKALDDAGFAFTSYANKSCTLCRFI